MVIAEKGGKGTVDDLRLRELLPKEKQIFFRYPGSLTTPPCSEAVVWTVFADSLPITQDQLDEFRALELKVGPGQHGVRQFDEFRLRNGRPLVAGDDLRAGRQRHERRDESRDGEPNKTEPHD